MKTELKQGLCDTATTEEAERILRACVHCGFCNATCPTYQLNGDELDGPRGRIYLIKSMLEGNVAGEETLLHLDRCLTCHACETTCPSGVEYGKLLDIGRQQVEQTIRRPVTEKIFRTLLLNVLPYRSRFRFLLNIAKHLRFILPERLKQKIPKSLAKKTSSSLTVQQHKYRVILFSGCVQSSLAPEINQSLKKVLNHLGVSVIEISEEQCCGALSQHLATSNDALTFMRKNIDLFWSYIEQGIDEIIVTASGCGVHLKEYGYLLREDSVYAEKAQRISECIRDTSEIMQCLQLDKIKKRSEKHIAFQSPCTLQHGQKLVGVTEGILEQLGFKLGKVDDAHLCCGSAGVYSLLQTDIADQLQENKINNLMKSQPEMILTANIGCLQHLREVSPVPVRHWIEAVADLVD